MSETRVHKWIAELGMASRREAERWIAEGRVAVNGRVLRTPGHKVNPLSDSISIDGKRLPKQSPTRMYYLLNKPDLTLTSRRSEKGMATIYDLPQVKRLKLKLNPVGRLDFRTEGLLLLSNDGELLHGLMHPRSRVPRTYSVLLTKPLHPEKMAIIRKGLYFDDGPVKGILIEKRNRGRMGKTQGQWYRITLKEGRNRIVRRIFQAVGSEVVRLRRVGFGGVNLPAGIRPGETRELTSQQIQLLRQAVSGEKTPRTRGRRPSITRTTRPRQRLTRRVTRR